MGYDVIGDIHGHGDRLEVLLGRLGYQHKDGAWRHGDRQAIFVGDLIDRGPGQLKVLSIVRAMTDAGSARVAMGNHELNAIGWMTPDPDEDGAYLRPRHGPKGRKNRQQHEAFLLAVGEETDAHRSWIDWFATLPIFIETPAFRVVHACWHQARADRLRPHLTDDKALRPDAMTDALKNSNEVGEAVNVLLKGAEVSLPDGVTFRDKDGHERSEIRTRWWDPTATTYQSAYMGPDGVEVPDLEIPDLERFAEPNLPTFIGHYWLDAAKRPSPLWRNVACVDYSVAKGGPLVAYRFDGETALAAEKFVAV